MVGTDGDNLLAAVLGQQPEILQCLEELHEAAWGVVDPVLLELCRLSIAMMLGCEYELQHRTPAARSAGLDEQMVAELAVWPTSERFGSRERACLAFTEQYVIDVAGMSDDIALAVSDELGPQAFRDFVAGLLVVEQRQRMRLAWERLFSPGIAQ